MSCGLQKWLGSGIAMAVAQSPATALIRPLAWKLPYASGAALKTNKQAKKKKKKKKTTKTRVRPELCGHTLIESSPSPSLYDHVWSWTIYLTSLGLFPHEGERKKEG